MPQLQINQGPQDALLYDNSRSYFTNVGYVRTSNFQVEYREVESQNTAAWGSTVNYIIPKAADLLGPVDLRVTIPAPTEDGFVGDTSGNTPDYTAVASTHLYTSFVDELGFAMIEKITFSVGNNDIETLTGEELQIRNELMTSDEMRLGHAHTLKTGKPVFSDETTPMDDELPGLNEVKLTAGQFVAGAAQNTKKVNRDYTRIITAISGDKHRKMADRHLIIPLGLFFTKHVSQYFPLAAVAGCNDIRIAIKFRQLSELVQVGGRWCEVSGDTSAEQNTAIDTTMSSAFKITKVGPPAIAAPTARLLCHYVHVTGPEAQTLMNKEHVRLLKLFQHQTEHVNRIQNGKIELNLSFLHPVSTLLITIRNEDDLTTEVGKVDKPTTFTPSAGTASATQAAAAVRALRVGGGGNGDTNQTHMKLRGKGFFFYHGDGTPPNYDRGDINLTPDDGQTGTVRVKGIKLTLNGQERHPGLTDGIDYEYLQHRLLPMLHSNSNAVNKQRLAMAPGLGSAQTDYGLQGSKNIFVYPFSLNPEGSNPSGAVNFSKVSHAKLTIDVSDNKASSTNTIDTFPLDLVSANAGGSLPSNISGLRVDVYALYYNWLQIKDGRALLSFA